MFTVDVKQHTANNWKTLYRLLSNPFPTVFPFFLRKLLLFFPENAKIIFLSGKAMVAVRCIAHPTASMGLGGPQTPGLLKILEFVVHSIYFALFCNVKNIRENILCYFYAVEYRDILKASRFYHKFPSFFSYFSTTFTSLKVLLFSYFF